VHLVGYIIRVYHNAWSPECQRQKSLVPAEVQKQITLAMQLIQDKKNARTRTSNFGLGLLLDTKIMLSPSLGLK